MSLDPVLTLCAVLFAFLGWMTWEANAYCRRERAQMTPQERERHDEEMRRWGQEW